MRVWCPNCHRALWLTGLPVDNGVWDEFDCQHCSVHFWVDNIGQIKRTSPEPQTAPHSPLWHLSEDNRAACKVCNPDQPSEKS